jgi:hypothetical protein
MVMGAVFGAVCSKGRRGEETGCKRQSKYRYAGMALLLLLLLRTHGVSHSSH